MYIYVCMFVVNLAQTYTHQVAHGDYIHAKKIPVHVRVCTCVYVHVAVCLSQTYAHQITHGECLHAKTYIYIYIYIYIYTYTDIHTNTDSRLLYLC